MNPIPASRQVLGVIVLVTGVRAILSLQLELTSVESYLWVCSQRPAAGYYDYPGMIAWMGWLSTTLFGHSPLGVRALMILGSAAMIGLVYLAARRLYDEDVGRLAAFGAALVPIQFVFSAEATPDAPCLLFWSATVWALAHALSGDSPRWWYAAGLFLGLAMDSKYHAVFLGLGVFGFLLFSPEQRCWLKRKQPWIAVLVALLAFSPTIFWNARNGWQSFAYQGVSRFKESGFQPSQIWKFPLSQLLLLTPVVAVAVWAVGLRTLVRWRSADWRDCLLTALGTPLLLFFFLVIFTRPVRGHWTVPGYVTPLILAAAAIVKGPPLLRRLYRASLGVLAAAWLLFPGIVALIPLESRRGWNRLGEQVAARKRDFVVTNDYHLASQLGYLLRTGDAWELTPAGKPAKNFPNWWNEADHRGKNAVVVFDKDHYPGEIDRVRAAFERVDSEEEVVIPRVQVLRWGGEARYVLLNAWNYKGPARADPRPSPSED